MSDRLSMPGALPAEYAERVSDRDDDPTPWRRRRRMTPQQIAAHIDETTRQVKASNDEDDNEPR